MEKRFCVLREALSSNVRSAGWNLLLAVPLRAAGLAAAMNAHGPKELLFSKASRGCGLVTLALALAWVAQGADLELIGQWPGWPRGFATGVAVSGKYAYVANGSGGLQVIDVSNPANPQRVSYCGTSGSAQGVAVSGNYAYVADERAGLQVIDVSNPAHPQWVGCYDTIAGGVAVSGNYAYVAAGWEGGLQVIDVSDPANPHWVSGYDTSGWGSGVAVSGNYAYVADGDAGLQVLDVSDPANPQWVAGCDTSGYPFHVAVSGNYAYVADWDAKDLQVIDVSDPANPQWVSDYYTSGHACGVAVSGNYAYVADGPWGLTILGPRAPRITSITRGAGTATVYYTNTIAGMAYTLECRTNLTTGNWQPVGTQPAPVNNASQTDGAAGGDQRYYRIFYQPQ